jgi:hypothetical protein
MGEDYYNVDKICFLMNDVHYYLTEAIVPKELED